MSETSTSSLGLQTTALQASDTVGRFELRRKLGQGAQSTVWLAFDPRMEREIALKIMHATSSVGDAAVTHWLQEARSVSKVKHPNIVPIYEADIEGRWPYLVFEFVAGRTLEQIAASRGPFAPQEAAALLMDVLDALAVAHEVGVVHRDLKPSNVLVDAAGRARLLDFGIAARIALPGQQAEVIAAGGTVGYLSPEAAGGLPPSASMDVFAAGVMLAELLMGERLLDEPDPARAIYRVAHEQLSLPQKIDIDDRLRAIVQRALARDPRQRFDSARAFLDALQAWAKPQAVTAAASEASAAQNGTLDFLLRRMRLKSDFPALSDSVVRIQSMASSETESVGSVTNEILKDVALTNKLLRLVNSAHYARGGNISTVSRAVTLVGFNGIRNMALSLVLLEHMQDKTHAAQLREEFLRSLMAGTIGSELCPQPREAEEAFLGAMFQNLGRLLVQFYFPEEAREVRNRVQSQREPVSEVTAAVAVLGLSFEELGLGVARAWGLPAEIQRSMRKPEGAPPTQVPSEARERLRWVALAANEIADVILHSNPGERDALVSKIARKYAQATGVPSQQIQSATLRARQKLVDLAKVMDIRVPANSQAAKLLSAPDTVTSLPIPADANPDETLGSLQLQAKQTDPMLGNVIPHNPLIAETLAAGIQDITNAMVDDFKLSDVLRMILETMFRALSFDRIIFCMRDAKTEMMTGRFGLGQGVEAYAKTFKLPLKSPSPDLFTVVCQKGADTLISDATEARIIGRLPPWYKTSLNAPTFLLLPLQIKGAPFGLIYADKVARDSLELDDKELALLRTLRNQAVMAFKQSS